MEKNKIGELCYWLMQQEKGKQLIDELKMMLANQPVLPQHPDVLAQFGGAELFMSYRGGQVSLLKYIELHSTQFRDQEIGAQVKANMEATQ